MSFSLPRVAPLLSLLFLLLVPPAVATPEPRIGELVADLVPAGAGGDSAPRSFTPLKDRAVFYAEQEGLGRELWTTDGTLEGTRLLLDACPGPCSNVEGALFSTGEVALWKTRMTDGCCVVHTLMRTDGTPEGTYALTDPNQLNPYSNLVLLDRSASDPVFLFLTAPTDSSDAPLELWRTDGTREGTFLLRRLDTTYDTAGLKASAGRAHVFQGRNGEDDETLIWISDGTAEGTRRLATRSLGDSVSTLSVGGVVYQLVGDSERLGWDLWAIGATPESIRSMGRGFRGYVGRGEYPDMAAVGGVLVLTAAEVDPVTGETPDGFELWTSDGTPAGTRPLTRFENEFALPELAPSQMARVGDWLLFPASDRSPTGTSAPGPDLWRAPLTGPAGAETLVSGSCPDCPAVQSPSAETWPSYLYPVGDRVYFAGTTDGTTSSIWWTDGQGIFPACPADHPACTDVQALTPLSYRRLPYSFGEASVPAFELVTLAAAADGGLEIWSLDRKEQAPRRVTRFPSDDPFPLTELGSRAFAAWVSLAPVAWGGGHLFAADAGLRGDEPWRADAAGSRLLRDIERSARGSQPRDLTRLGERLLFTASETGDALGDLWAVSPASPEAPPARIFSLGRSALCGESGIRSLSAAEAVAYFVCGPPTGELEIWRTDGTADGTRLLSEPEGVAGLDERLAGGRIVTDPAFWGDRAFFVINTASSFEIWETDGTAAGTGPVAEVPGVGGKRAAGEQVLAAGGLLYVNGQQDAGTPRAVWASDGTQAGTVEVFSFSAGYIMETGSWRASGAAVFLPLQALGGDHLRLWRVDGTGSRLVAEIPDRFWLDGVEVYDLPPALQDPPRGPDFYFLVSDGAVGPMTLWTVPATGTHAVEVGPAGLTATVPLYREAELTAGFGRAFFVARDPEHGTELWSSDGTAVGTGLVVDGNPGPASSDPRALTAVDGTLYFSANDGVHGLEPWTSDGTASGTGMVHDLAPGPASSGNRPADPMAVPPLVHAPGGFTRVVDRLYFRANDGIFGEELWSLPLGGSGLCEPSSRHLCLAGGRFRAELAALATREAGGQEAPGMVRGTARPVTADTGAFWLFREPNLELAVKMLDGRPVNEHFWVFYTALSNQHFFLTVTDQSTGLTRRYEHPGGFGVSVGDAEAFGPKGVPLERRHAAGSPAALDGTADAASVAAFVAASGAEATPTRTDLLTPAAEGGTCQPGPERLCLLDGRYAVEVAWTRKNGDAGPGRPVALSDDATSETAAFWFFREANLELFVKMVDGADVNGHVWFFYGALSNVGYTVTVTETATGRTRTYDSPQGSFTSVADGRAFDVMP